MAGRKAYQPTDKDRGRVEAMAAYGIPQEQIGRVLGVSHVTLRKYYEEELETAETNANAAVAGKLYAACMVEEAPGKPDPRHNAARMFWLKTRANWRETNNLEHSGKIAVTDDANTDELTRRIDSLAERLGAGRTVEPDKPEGSG